MHASIPASFKSTERAGAPQASMQQTLVPRWTCFVPAADAATWHYELPEVGRLSILA